jgi:hypothetical protein
LEQRIVSRAPIVGYRAWNVGSTGALCSLFNEAIWLVGKPLTAKCLGVPPNHEAPCSWCQCGIYARTTLDGIFAEVWSRGLARSPDSVIGAVLLFGNTYHGKSEPQVVRAQYAQPVCLLAEDTWYPMQVPDEPYADILAWRAGLEMASERYLLPIVPRSGIAQYAAEFGEPLVAHEDERVAPMQYEPRWRSWWPRWGQ